MHLSSAACSQLPPLGDLFILKLFMGFVVTVCARAAWSTATRAATSSGYRTGTSSSTSYFYSTFPEELPAHPFQQEHFHAIRCNHSRGMFSQLS